jgi:Ser/Thr protein kinase RdoA (MazF antagonist)
MNITPEIVTPLLREYGISSTVTDIYIYRSQSDKIVARVDVKHRGPLVIRLTRDSRNTRDFLERRSVFSEHLRRNGIPTPERYSKGGVYCLEREIENKRYSVTLEDWCGDPLTHINHEDASDAGKIMARIHRNSFRDNFKLGSPTAFNAVGKNSLTGINKFRELAKMAADSQYKSVTYPHKLCSNPEIFNEIIDIYEQKISSVSAIWDRLPCAAVQGCISTENLTRRNGIMTIFDYNSAGDETLVGDMILVGMLLTYESDLDSSLSDTDRAELFLSFLDGYRGICPLTREERIAACDIFPAYNALWFSRISSDGLKHNDSLESAMLAGNRERVDEILTQIYRLITDDARKIFASELFSERRQ